MQQKVRSFSQPSAVLVAVGITAAIVAAGVSLWHVIALHSYIIGVGAGMAAFLAPLPGLVRPQAKGKWHMAVALSAVIGLGVWFGADSMAEARESAERRLDTQRRSTEIALMNLPAPARDAVILSIIMDVKKQYHEREFLSVLDLVHIIKSTDEANGHALYYAGEAYRSLQNRIDMRGALQHYLAEASRRADSVDGDAARCYERPHGYCGERTEWVNHLMANDYAAEADASPEARRADLLLTAYRYEHHVLETRPLGFYGLQTVKSSCETLKHTRDGMRALNQNTLEIEGDLRSLRCAAAIP